MAQFDVHRYTGALKAVIPYVVVVQSRRFDRSRHRVVIPLVVESLAPPPDPTLNPAFTIEGMPVLLDPLQIVALAAARLGAHVGSLEVHGDRVIAAIDLVIARAWD